MIDDIIDAIFTWREKALAWLSSAFWAWFWQTGWQLLLLALVVGYLFLWSNGFIRRDKRT